MTVPPRRELRLRLAWFIGLWLAGVAATGLVTLLLRLTMAA